MIKQQDAETVRSIRRTTKAGRGALMLSAGALALICAQPALAQPAVNTLPTGANPIHGVAAPTVVGSNMTVHQSADRALIEWGSFSIGSDASVTFVQPDSSSVIVNRVQAGGGLSEIYGHMHANGVVAILNPNGVHFGGSAEVNVGGLIASTGDLADQAAYLAGGALSFTGSGGGDVIIASGADISVASAGLAAFVAPHVSNSGVITATGGRVMLAAGEAFTLDLAGDGLLEITVPTDSPLVENYGAILAAGGRIQMTAAAAAGVVDNVINLGGVLPGGGVHLDGDTIVIEATAGDIRVAAGGLDVNGDIEITSGRRVYGATIDVTDGALDIALNAAGAANPAGNWIRDALNVVGTVEGGTTINLGEGVYTLSATLDVRKDNVALVGAGQGVTTIDASGRTAYGIYVNADDVTLSGFTLSGPTAVNNQTFGIKAQAQGDASARMQNLTITNVVIDGANKNGLDLNGVVGALIDHVTVTNTANGNGIAVTDSADVTISNSVTSNNAWGGLALYNRNAAFSQQLADISVEGSNTFGETVGVYLQDYASALNDVGALTIEGFDFAVHNGDYTYFHADSADATAHALGLSAPQSVSIEGWTGTGYDNTFTVVDGLAINAAVREARNGAVINIAPGDYLEGVTSVDHYGNAGGQRFGLHVFRDGVTLRGVDSSGNVITDANDVAAFITAQHQAGFGAQHFISGSGVTIEGLGFLPAAAGNNKAVEVIGEGFTLRNSVIDNRGNITAANFYISTFATTPGAPVVESFTLQDNIFYGGSTANAMVVIASGVGRNTDASNRIFHGNQLIGNGLEGQRGFQIQGAIPSTGWQQLTAGAVTVTNNTFTDVDVPVRTTGILTQSLDWNAVFNGNNFMGGAALAFQGDSLQASGVTVVDGGETYQDIRITREIQDSIEQAQAGDTVRALAGVYNQALSIDQSVTVLGAGVGETILRPTASLETNVGHKRDSDVSAAVFVNGANNVVLDGLTIDGNGLNNDAGVFWTNASGQIRNVHITNIRPYTGEQTGHGLAVDATAGHTTNLTVAGVVFDTWNKNAIDVVTGQGASSGGGDINLTVRDTVITGRGVTAVDAQNGIMLWERGGGTINALIDNVSISDMNFTGSSTATGVLVYGSPNGGATIRNSSFADLETYIALDGGSLREMDATQGNVFDGVAADSATLRQLIAIEDGVIHGVDRAGNGLIRVRDGHVFVTDRASDGAINRAVQLSASGDTINIAPGDYLEGVTGVDHYGNAGGQKFGLHVFRDDITLRGIDANGEVITDAGNVAAFITAQHQAGFGAQHFISGSGVTIEGLGFLPAAAGNNKAVEVIGNRFTLRNSVIDNRGNITAANFYISDFDNPGTERVESFTLENNLFYSGTLAHTQVVIASGVGRTTDASNRVLTGNAFYGNGVAGQRGFQIQGRIPSTGWQQLTAGPVTLTGNTFTDVDIPVRVTGVLSGVMDWAGLFLGNTFTDGGVLAFKGDTAEARGLLVTDGGETYEDIRITTSIQDSIDRAANGDTVRMLDGTYALNTHLLIDRSITLEGQSQAGVVIDASATPTYGIRVHADDVSLSGFTLSGGNGYGIKVEAAGSPAPHLRRNNFLISDVTIEDTWRTGLDLNAVYGAEIHGVTVTGVGNGNGISITDSAYVTVSNSTTSGNAWAGVGLFQRNNVGSGGSDQQLTNIFIEDSNSFGEAEGVYLQAYASALHSVGVLTIEGYDFAIQNDGQNPAGDDYVWFRTSLQDALNKAVNVASRDRSVVGGWNGSDHDGNLYVGFGELAGGGQAALSIQAAFDASDDGDAINIASGDYGQSSTLNWVRVVRFDDVTTESMTFGAGAAGAGVSGRLTAGDIVLANVILTDSTTLIGDTVSVAGVEGSSVNGQSLIIQSAAASLGSAGADVALRNLMILGNATLTGSEYAAFGVAVNGAANLARDVSITASGPVVLGAVDGAHALSIQAGGSATLGRVGAATALASLTISGSTISTAGATTTGSQSYAGATTLNGAYASGGDFAVAGATTLSGATTIASGGDASLDAVSGPYGLTVEAEDAVTLGSVNAASLSATGSTISTSGATTTGGQTYAGATTLNGAYASGGDFAVAGATTLGGATTIASGGDASLGAVSGAFGLTVSSEDAVTLGSVNAASLSATGSTISTSGATTTGSQSYAGATTLNGAYASGGDFAVAGATTLSGATTIASGGDASLDAVSGPYGLTVEAEDAVTLGSVNAASLSATGSTISTSGATTTGGQTYAGATTLNGAYASGGDFAVAGATTLGGATTIASGGDASLGAVSGAFGLTVSSEDAVTLGSVNAASLSATGSTISTSGATTTGSQSYAGATTLNGAYASGGDFAVAGATTLSGATTIASGGDASLDAVSGPYGLTVEAEDAVTLGSVNAASLSATGSTISTSGATTTGSQSYAGATTLNGAYASGGDFAVAGATTVTGAVTVATSGGSARFGAVNGSSAGGQSFTLNTNGGAASLGAMGARVRLGAVSVTAGRTVLNGATYAGDSLYFGGGAGATVRLTQVTTTFNTVQSATTGGAITILPHLIGTVNGEQGVVFLAGSGVSAGDGDVSLRNAGTDAVRLGAMTATGGDFSAETVKLAGDFTSRLSGDQLFSANTLDTLGNVDVMAAGAESGPIIAGGSVNINAGRSGTGSIQAGGPVNTTYGAGTDRIIVASGPVTVNAGGPVGGSITSGGAVNITSGGAITSTINADGAIVLTSTQPVQVLVNGGVVTVNAPGGTISGVFSRISTDPRGTFVINGETIVGEGVVNARQILVDGFIVPAGGVVGATGQISLPAGLAIALIAPAGEGEGQRPAVIVNNVDRLGELLRLGYTAIVIQIDESGLVFEEELVVAQTEIHQAASGAQ